MPNYDPSHYDPPAPVAQAACPTRVAGKHPDPDGRIGWR